MSSDYAFTQESTPNPKIQEFYRQQGRIQALENLSLYEWLIIGTEHGFCSSVICNTHEALPLSEEEDEAFQSNDPCIHAVRVYINQNEYDILEKSTNGIA